MEGVENARTAMIIIEPLPVYLKDRTPGSTDKVTQSIYETREEVRKELSNTYY